MDQKKKIGKYFLTSLIGQGSFGEVYKAKIIGDETKTFAVKCVPKSKIKSNSSLERLFETELQVMATFDHPNLMRLYEFIETQNNYYLVLPFCKNGDLDAYVKKVGHLSETEAVYFLRQIMNGFRVLDQRKIMHRDIKLANLFLDDDRVVIGDFGFAKEGADLAITRLGTPLNMAPELLQENSRLYSSKADLWSVGCCFYEMLFGKAPFMAANKSELLIKQQRKAGENLDFPENIPISDQCKDLLIRMLQFKPSERITWVDFFNHPIFDLRIPSNETEAFQNTHKSTLMRQSEPQILSEFNDNKIKTGHYGIAEQPEIKDPKQPKISDESSSERKNNNDQTDKDVIGKNILKALNHINVTPLPTTQTQEEVAKPEIEMAIDAQVKLEDNLRLLELRYTHEANVVFFILTAAQKFRDLAKLKNASDGLAGRFMYAACLLAKKGLLEHERLLESLQSNNNIFKMHNFDEFSKTSEKDHIIATISKDHKIYETYINQISTKAKTRKIMAEQMQEIAECLDYKLIHLPVLKDKARALFEYLKTGYNLLLQDDHFKVLYCHALVHGYYAVFSEENFEFMRDNKPFQWLKFENSVEIGQAKTMLSQLSFK